MKLDIKGPLETALKKLGKREQEVIISRFGLKGQKPQTLQKIADQYDFTRERARQIQETGLNKLREDKCVRIFSSAIQQLKTAVETCGSATSTTKLHSFFDATSVKEQGYINLLLNISDHFKRIPSRNGVCSYWHTEDVEPATVEAVLQQVHAEFEGDVDRVVTAEEMGETMKAFLAAQSGTCAPRGTVNYVHLLDLSEIVKSNTDGYWGHRKNPEIAENSMNGSIRTVLRNAGGPLHFVDIADKVTKLRGKTCNAHSCHNELVRNELFVLVGRGIYALAEAGYRPGNIADVIQYILEEHGPLTTPEIVDKVTAERHVKPNSVIQSLFINKHKFTRTRDGKYKTAKV